MRTNVNRSLSHLLIAICIVAQPFGAEALWDVIPLFTRVLGADLIVVGKLTQVRDNEILVKHREYRNRDREFDVHLDTGVIEASQILLWNGKRPGPRKDPKASYPFRLAWHSTYQPQPDGTDMIVSTYLHFDEGDEGVWLLKLAPFTDYHYAVTYPDDFLPLDSLAVVEHEIDRLLKSIGGDQSSK